MLVSTTTHGVVIQSDGDLWVPCLLSDAARQQACRRTNPASSCPRQAWAWHPFSPSFATYTPIFLNHNKSTSHPPHKSNTAIRTNKPKTMPIA